MQVSRYLKGIETRNLILLEAKKVFYQKGYNKATITEICNNIDIKGGTFTYYFEKKTDIAHEIYSELLMKCYDFVERTESSPLNSIQKNVRSVFLYHLALFRDQNTIAFHYEILQKESAGDYIGSHVDQIYRDFDEELKLGLTEKEISDAASADAGARRELTRRLFREKNFQLSSMDVLEFDATINTLMGRIFTMKEETIKEAICEAREFVKNNDYSELRLLI